MFITGVIIGFVVLLIIVFYFYQKHKRNSSCGASERANNWVITVYNNYIWITITAVYARISIIFLLLLAGCIIMAITCVLNRKEKYKTSRQITIYKKALKSLVLSGQSITPILGYVLIVGDTIQQIGATVDLTGATVFDLGNNIIFQHRFYKLH